MRVPRLSALVFLAVLAPAAAAAPRTTSREYTPPPQPGDIYTVIDFSRSRGAAEATSVSETMGQRRRDFVAVPHHYCTRTTPTGIVVRFRHFDAEQVPLTVTTTGAIVRGPYQGGLPLEAMHHCYELTS
jgi:hypothetical protein